MAKRRETEADLLMWDHLQELTYGTRVTPMKEVRFCERRWRFDFGLVAMLTRPKVKVKVGIEIEGGVWIQGRHTRGSGFVKDMEKYNEAARRGWYVLRFTPAQVLDGTALAFLKRVLES